MFAGTYRISAASESAAVTCRLALERRAVMNEPQRLHSATMPEDKGSTAWTRPQVSQETIDSDADSAIRLVVQTACPGRRVLMYLSDHALRAVLLARYPGPRRVRAAGPRGCGGQLPGCVANDGPRVA